MKGYVQVKPSLLLTLHGIRGTWSHVGSTELRGRSKIQREMPGLAGISWMPVGVVWRPNRYLEGSLRKPFFMNVLPSQCPDFP